MANNYKHILRVSGKLEDLNAIKDQFNDGKFVGDGSGIEHENQTFTKATEIPSKDQMEDVDVPFKDYLEIRYITRGFSTKVPEYLAKHMTLGGTLEDCFIDYDVIDFGEMTDVIDSEKDLKIIRKQVPDPTEEQLELFNEIQVNLHGAMYFARNERWTEYQRAVQQASCLMRQDFGHLLYPTETDNIENINLDNGRIH